MSWYPAIPGWDGLHPALVHFPVALLMVAPLLLLGSVIARQSWRTWAWAALVVMALGALATWMAVGSGHAAGQLVDKTQTLTEAITRHEALGMATRNLFTLLTLLFATFLLVPVMLRRPLAPALRVTLSAVFLLVFIGATGLVAHTANQGGHLVHELGIKAMVTPAPSATPAPAPRG